MKSFADAFGLKFKLSFQYFYNNSISFVSRILIGSDKWINAIDILDVISSSRQPTAAARQIKKQRLKIFVSILCIAALFLSFEKRNKTKIK